MQAHALRGRTAERAFDVSAASLPGRFVALGALDFHAHACSTGFLGMFLCACELRNDGTWFC